jgi:parallel beta-helix repeat protein
MRRAFIIIVIYVTAAVLISQTLSSQSLNDNKKRYAIPQLETSNNLNTVDRIALTKGVHNLDTGLNYASIQEAINAPETLNGHTIFVEAGIYYENVVVNKSLTLIGENEDSTFIDGNGTGTVVRVVVEGVVMSGFTVRNSGSSLGPVDAGIWISQPASITNNIITKNAIGVYINSVGSNITKNTIANNGHGISLYASSKVTVKSNNFSANTYGISLVAYSSNNILMNNSIIESSTGGHAIYLSNSFNNTVLNNYLVNNYHGIWLSNSFNNRIMENFIANNKLLGIELASSSDNVIYHNNFINNTKHVVIDNKSINFWDNGYPSGGNYWSNYTNIDKHSGPNQNQPDSDGIWDNPYIINENNTDSYPLTGMFYSYGTSLGHEVHILSNSTIEDFRYFTFNQTIRLYVSNSSATQTCGFCRVCIPHVLMDVDNISVVIDDGLTPVLYANYMLYDNGTHRWIYFAYPHSKREIIIIPEFTSSLILPLLIMITLLAVIPHGKSKFENVS